MRSGEATRGEGRVPKSQQGKCRPLDLPICPFAHLRVCVSAHRLLSRTRDPSIPPSSMKIGRRRKWLGVKTGAELQHHWGPSLADHHPQLLRCLEPELISARWATRDGGMLRVTSSAKSPPGRSATVCGGAAEACEGTRESATPSQPRLDASCLAPSAGEFQIVPARRPIWLYLQARPCMRPRMRP